MNFLAIVLALLIVYFTDYAARFVHRHDFFTGYIQLLRKASFMRGVAGFTITMIIAILVVGFLTYWLLGFLFGLPGFIFVSLVLLLCLERLPDEAEQTAESLLKTAMRTMFGVLFWFAILGPVGAVLYRLLERMPSVDDDPKCSGCAELLLQWAEWIPARLLAITFALVSHFFSVSQCWVQQAISGPSNNQGCLLGCFDLAYQSEKQEGDEVEARNQYMVKLLHRALVAWLVILALLVLV